MENQLLVDIEIEVDDSFLEKYDFKKGESFIIDDTLAEEIYTQCKNENKIKGEFPGGAVGNTLHNYSVLSEGPCFALGCINRNIVVIRLSRSSSNCQEPSGAETKYSCSSPSSRESYTS